MGHERPRDEGSETSQTIDTQRAAHGAFLSSSIHAAPAHVAVLSGSSPGCNAGADDRPDRGTRRRPARALHRLALMQRRGDPRLAARAGPGGHGLGSGDHRGRRRRRAGHHTASAKLAESRARRCARSITMGTPPAALQLPSCARVPAPRRSSAPRGARRAREAALGGWSRASAGRPAWRGARRSRSPAPVRGPCHGRIP